MGHTMEVWGLESAEEMGGIGEKWLKSERAVTTDSVHR